MTKLIVKFLNVRQIQKAFANFSQNEKNDTSNIA